MLWFVGPLMASAHEFEARASGTSKNEQELHHSLAEKCISSEGYGSACTQLINECQGQCDVDEVYPLTARTDGLLGLLEAISFEKSSY